MLPKEILQKMGRGEVMPLYYLHGEELFKREEFIEKFLDIFFGAHEGKPENKGILEKVASKGHFGIEKLHADSSSVFDILDSVSTLGLFGASQGNERKAVLVRDAHLIKSPEPMISWFEQQTSVANQENVILLMGDFDGRKKFHQWLKKRNLAVEFAKANDRELSQWAQYLAKKRGISLTPEAIEFLILASNGSLSTLDQEIEKASLHKGVSLKTSKAALVEISVEDISIASLANFSKGIPDIVEALFEGKRTRALLSAEKHMLSPEDLLGFIGFCTWAVKNVDRFSSSRTLLQRLSGAELIYELGRLDQKAKSSGQDALSLFTEFAIRLTSTRPLGICY